MQPPLHSRKSKCADVYRFKRLGLVILLGVEQLTLFNSITVNERCLSCTPCVTMLPYAKFVLSWQALYDYAL
jgi:hypothetical protein